MLDDSFVVSTRSEFTFFSGATDKMLVTAAKNLCSKMDSGKSAVEVVGDSLATAMQNGVSPQDAGKFIDWQVLATQYYCPAHTAELIQVRKSM